ncbi:Kel2p [Malassezia vespertilionis]|uniref:Kel2p n=1 Tax=Malassezia vespertilionis TaxID=2020962 RepID=A0A2N1JG78_9BASI|nr:Kel2p [Malassezia vespertilionis]
MAIFGKKRSSEKERPQQPFDAAAGAGVTLVGNNANARQTGRPGLMSRIVSHTRSESEQNDASKLAGLMPDTSASFSANPDAVSHAPHLGSANVPVLSQSLPSGIIPPNTAREHDMAEQVQPQLVTSQAADPEFAAAQPAIRKVVPHNAASPAIEGSQLQERTRQQNIVYPWGQKQITMNPPRFLDESRRAPPGVLSPPPFPRYGHASNQSTGSNNEVYIFGGLVRDSVKNDMYITKVEHTQIQRSNGVKTDIALNATLVQTSGQAPLPRVGHAAVLVSNVFILWGGDTKIRAEDKQDDALYLLNLNNREWTRVLAGAINGAGPIGRYGHTLSVIGSNLFVFGGQVESTFFDELWRFDLNSLKTTPTWELVQTNGNTPPRRTGHSSIVYRNRLYIFGGTDSNFHYNDTWCFDLVTYTWTELKCVGYIPAPREGHAACMVDDIMYVFGGRGVDGNDLGDLASFKITSHRWFMFAHMGPAPFGRSGHTMVTTGNRILVVGGESFTGAVQDEPTCMHVLDTTKIKYPAKSERGAKSQAEEQPESKSPAPATKDMNAGMEPVPLPVTTSQTTGSVPAPPEFASPRQELPASSYEATIPDVPPPVIPQVSSTPELMNAANPYAAPQPALTQEELAGLAPPVQANLWAAPMPDAALEPVVETRAPPAVAPPPPPAASQLERTPSLAKPSSALDASDSARTSEMWLASMLALAVKQGFVPPTQAPLVQDTLDVETLDVGQDGSGQEATIKSLLTLKTQIAAVRTGLNEQMQTEETRMAAQERARLAALQEAAYYRAKLVASESSNNIDERVHLERQRVAQLEKLLTTATRENAELDRKVAVLHDQARLEARLRSLAEDRLSETTKRAVAAEEAHIKVYDEYSALQKHTYVTESLLRDHAAEISALTSTLAKQQSERGVLEDQVSTTNRSVETSRAAFAQFQEALNAAHAQNGEYERQRAEHMRQYDTQSQTVMQLRTDLQARAAELEAKNEQLEQQAAVVAELETIVNNLQREAQTHREAATGGLAQLLALQNTRDSLDTSRDASHTNAEFIQALQDEARSLHNLQQESRRAVDNMALTVQETTERANQLQRTNNKLYNEVSVQRKQLAQALHDLAMVKDNAQAARSSDDSRQMEEFTVKNMALRQLLSEHNVDVPDDDVLANPQIWRDRRTTQLERDLERCKENAMNNAIELERSQDRLHQVSLQLEKTVRDARTSKTLDTRAELQALRQRAEEAEYRLDEAVVQHQERTSQLENDYLTAVQFVRNTENMLRRLKEEHLKLRQDNAELRSGAHPRSSSAGEERRGYAQPRRVVNCT